MRFSCWIGRKIVTLSRRGDETSGSLRSRFDFASSTFAFAFTDTSATVHCTVFDQHEHKIDDSGLLQRLEL